MASKDPVTAAGMSGEHLPRRSTRWPAHLRRLHRSTWWGVLARSVHAFLKDNCADWAASLTYYAVLAIFPSAIVIVALVNLVSDGDKTVDTIVGLAKDLGAGSVVADPVVVDVIRGVVSRKDSAGVLLSFGLVAALWSASGYAGGFTRASNAIYGVEEKRPFYKLWPLQLGVTALALILLAGVAAVLIISGPVTDAVGNALGLGEAARTAWTVVKWPALVLVAMLLLSLLFWIAPNVRQPRFRWLTIGGLVTLITMTLASFGFGLYVGNFGAYDATYGSIGAVIAFLVWLYLCNCAVMLGVEVNAEVQRGRARQGGAEDPDEPVLPSRSPANP
jgi:membrane protein